MRKPLAVLAVSASLIGVAHAQGGPSTEALRRNNYGAALLKQGKLEEASEEFRQAARTDPGYVAALLNLAQAYELQGRIDEAIIEYRRVLEREPGNSLAQNNLGVLYDRKGLHDEAIRELEHVLQRDPTDTSATKNLETAKRNHATVKEREEQLAGAMKGFEARPRDPRAAYGVARTHAIHGQKDQALEWLAKALDLGFDDFQFLTVDPALVGLREDPRFTRLVEGRAAQRAEPR